MLAVVVDFEIVAFESGKGVEIRVADYHWDFHYADFGAQCDARWRQAGDGSGMNLARRDGLSQGQGQAETGERCGCD